jgi:hypothetical protein
VSERSQVNETGGRFINDRRTNVMLLLNASNFSTENGARRECQGISVLMTSDQAITGFLDR